MTQEQNTTEKAETSRFSENGLTKQEVEERIAAGKLNTPVTSSDLTLKDIIFENVFTYFNFLFVAIAVCLCLVRAWRDLTFLPLIISNTLIGIVQEWRSKQLLDKLKIMTDPKVNVIRDGVQEEILATELVEDDLIVLGSGNQVPADGVVTQGEVLVNEALLTGEADLIAHSEGAELLSGSFVVSGSCHARLTKVGAESFSAKLTTEAKMHRKGEDSEMIRSLNKLVRIVGALIIPIGALLFWQQFYVNHIPVADAVKGTVAAILGMIPEGLYLLASVAMAVSAVRLAMNHVLVHNMKSIETLARVDVLCVDKTGTITENTMSVKEAIPVRPLAVRRAAQQLTMNPQPDGSAGADVPAGSGAQETPGEGAFSQAAPGEGMGAASQAPESAKPEDVYAAYEEYKDESVEDQRPGQGYVVDGFTAEDIAALELAIGDFAACMGSDNATMRAIKAHFTKQTGRRPEQIVPFDPTYKFSGAVFGRKTYVLGAPELILREDYPIYRGAVEQHTMYGYRVLIFAEYEGELERVPLSARAVPVGMILLSNPIREKAPATFRYFAEQNVTVKVISGDNPLTVSEVAQEAGIPGADQFVDTSSLTDEELAACCDEFTVFGRVTPQQKRVLVKALKKNGHTVAMTGDGVNDVLALKDADCSIAMASGADAAQQAAQMVLLESDFSRMPSVVNEGRRVVNNIERTASLFLVKNIFSLFMSIFSIIFAVSYPLEPSQVSLISAFTIGIPAFFLSLENNNSQIKGHFLGNVFFKALPAGLTDFIVISALVIFCQEFGVRGSDLSTSCTILLAIVGFMILFRIMMPMTKYHAWLWLSMILGLLLCMIFLNDIFYISMLSRRCTMLLVIFAILTEPVLRYLSLVTEKCRLLIRYAGSQLKRHQLDKENLFADMK